MRSSHQSGPELSRLEERLFLSASVVISEFLASNDSGLVNDEGERSDWIELYNPTATAVDLDGWFLTDDADHSDLWRIPAVTIDPGGFLVIFASDEDHDEPDEPLHTDFKLSADGEYLALLRPDGTVAHEYAPEFPRQVEDVSYGLPFEAGSTEAVNLLVPTDAGSVLVPDAGSWDAAWMTPGFNDAGWTACAAAVGYETEPESDTSYEGHIHTDLQSEMYGTATTALLRIPFTVDNLAEIVSLTLSVCYDDGFAAYINGVPVAAANAPSTLNWDSFAPTSHSDSLAILTVDFDVSTALASLVEGENVLAIQALNVSASSSDFLLTAELTADVAAQAIDDPQYFVTPTPGEANVPGTLGFVKDTKFSVDRGFFDTPFELEITCETPGAEIRYTLDGSTPTATHGAVYGGPIVIAGQTVVRAAAFKAGYQPSDVDAQTYIFVNDVLVQPDVPDGYPSVWNGDNYTRPGDYGMDPEIVNDPAYAAEMDAAFKAIPTISITTDIANLFDPDTGIYIKATREGMDYERPCTVEYFTADGSDEFTINCGIRMRGGASRSQRTTPKHSFRLIFRDMYGAGKLNYPLFGPEATDSFDTIILRAGSNLSWPHHNGWPVYSENRQYAQYVRDAWAKQTQLEMGWPTVRENYAHLYINGIYWGLYNPGERPSAPFAADYLGGEKEDYDVINSGQAIDGNMTAWNQLMALSQQNLANAANYQQIGDMLDLEAFADYMIINQYGGNIDWDHHNWHAFRNREAGGKWYFAVWDTEIIFVNLNENRIDPSKFGQFEPSSAYNASANVLTRMWVNLMANSEFEMMFADRVHKYLFNDGLLTPEGVVATWQPISDVVYSPIICESARWGDYRRDVYYAGRDVFDDHQLYDRDEEWAEEYRRLMEDYFPYRTDVVINQYKSYGAYPQLAAPSFNVDGAYQHGGTFAPGDGLTLSAGSGTVLYTLDGSDPRLPGGAISPLAMVYTGQPITLGDNVTVKARTYAGGAWSALNEADYVTEAAAGLLVSEINYNPAAPTLTELAAGIDDADAFEFIELHNRSSEAVSLTGLALSGGIAFEFDGSNVATLPAGGYVLVVRNEQAFAMRYGFGYPIAGEFTGGLNNAFDTVALTYGNLDETLVKFTYYDDGGWSGRADGKGATLVLDDPSLDPSDPDAWRGSSEYLGSPGSAAAPISADVVINEVLAHTDLPQVDSIELHNLTGGAVDLSGWYLSDDSGEYTRFRIPDGTILPAHGYIVFDEYDFNPSGIDEDPSNDQPGDFGLDGAHGEHLWLMAADASGALVRFVDDVKFGSSANGVSFARLPDGVGRLQTAPPSLGAANTAVTFGPVVISEIMYNPSGLAGLPMNELLSADFATWDTRFSFTDDAFGTANPDQAAGSVKTGYMETKLAATFLPGHYSGGWSVDFYVDESAGGRVTFTYDALISAAFYANDGAAVMVSVDGVAVGDLAGGAVNIIDGTTVPLGTQYVQTEQLTGEADFSLNAGWHTLTIGLYGYFDNVLGGTAVLNLYDMRIDVSGSSDHMEYVELANTSAAPVLLNGWQLDGGVDFDFADGTVIPAGGRLIVTDFNPTLPGGDALEQAFRQTYGLDASVAVVGGYFGQLSNGGESIRLLAPDEPPITEPEFIPMLTMDEATFDDLSPWPASADGQGLSLVRVRGQSGRLGGGWLAAEPSPGSGILPLQGDFNGDGVVGIQDFVTLKQNYGQSGRWVNTADANGDGVVDIQDFVALKRNYGVSVSAVPASAAPQDAADLLAETRPLEVPAPLPVDHAVRAEAFNLWLIPPEEI